MWRKLWTKVCLSHVHPHLLTVEGLELLAKLECLFSTPLLKVCVCEETLVRQVSCVPPRAAELQPAFATRHSVIGGSFRGLPPINATNKVSFVLWFASSLPQMHLFFWAIFAAVFLLLVDMLFAYCFPQWGSAFSSTRSPVVVRIVRPLHLTIQLPAGLFRSDSSSAVQFGAPVCTSVESLV